MKYGDLGETGLFTEETSYEPSSPYSASKAASDHLVRLGIVPMAYRLLLNALTIMVHIIFLRS